MTTIRDVDKGKGQLKKFPLSFSWEDELQKTQSAFAAADQKLKEERKAAKEQQFKDFMIRLRKEIKPGVKSITLPINDIDKRNWNEIIKNLGTQYQLSFYEGVRCDGSKPCHHPKFSCGQCRHPSITIIRK